MNNATNDPADRPVGTLLRDLSRDVSDLVRQEMALAKAETSEKINQVTMAAASMIGGVVLAHAALLVLLLALVAALSEVMEPWLASLIVGVVVAVIGYALVRKGQNDLSASRLAPSRTAANLQKDANLAKEHVR
ncbi:MAG: phage holin family protein [Geminicoccaceae bacterium]|nr:phage holin family protein [Geminicoccaceae bacterium]